MRLLGLITTTIQRQLHRVITMIIITKAESRITMDIASVMPETRVHEHPNNYGNGYVYGHDSVEESRMHGHD